MELCSIASGSSGNCIFVSDGTTRLLVDDGISKIRVEKGLSAIGHSADEIDGILITHEHADHINGLGVLSRKYKIPIYGTRDTLRYIDTCSALGAMPGGLYREITGDRPFFIEDMKIIPICTSHDAADSLAYRFESGDSAVAVMTDLGCYDEYIVEKLQNLDALVLESNHDICMLEVGPYPYPLKQRILGERGHLSNEASARLAKRIISDRLKYIVLGHLSKENNMPVLALETYRCEFELSGVEFDMNRISVAKRDEVSELITV